MKWRKTHNREAIHQRQDGSYKCDPKLGGIMFPCIAIDIEGKPQPPIVDECVPMKPVNQSAE